MAEAIQKKTSVLAMLSLVLGCLSIIPFYGSLFSIPALILGIIALVKISKEGNNLKGRDLAIRGILLGVLGMLISIAIILPSILGAREASNQQTATASVRTISDALETYAKANNGKYPMSESALVDGNAPYLSKSYDNQVIHGYRYLLELNTNSYKVVAKPEKCGTKWTKVITMVTGGVVQEQECK